MIARACNWLIRSDTSVLQGSPQRRQLAERIFAYEFALPEDLVQQGRGPPGNINRLLKTFRKLLTGVQCCTVDVSLASYPINSGKSC